MCLLWLPYDYGTQDTNMKPNNRGILFALSLRSSDFYHDGYDRLSAQKEYDYSKVTEQIVLVRSSSSEAHYQWCFTWWPAIHQRVHERRL